MDDLDRVLGYCDAADGRLGSTALGPDLLVVPFWTRAFCAAIVRAAELVGFAADPDDPVPGREVSLATISPRLYEATQDDLGSRIWPQLREVWPLIDYHGLRDAFVIRYARGEQEELRRHHDVAQVSASVKLDDGYVGADLRFPRQGVDNREVPVGALLAWAVARHPPARVDAPGRGGEARVDDVVRAADVRPRRLNRDAGRRGAAGSLAVHGGGANEAGPRRARRGPRAHRFGRTLRPARDVCVHDVDGQVQ